MPRVWIVSNVVFANVSPECFAAFRGIEGLHRTGRRIPAVQQTWGWPEQTVVPTKFSIQLFSGSEQVARSVFKDHVVLVFVALRDGAGPPLLSLSLAVVRELYQVVGTHRCTSTPNKQRVCAGAGYSSKELRENNRRRRGNRKPPSTDVRPQPH